MKYIAAICSVIAIGCAMFFYTKVSYMEARPSVKIYEKSYADSAMRLEAAHNRKALHDVEDFLYPVAISENELIRVQLKPRRGVMGRSPFYVFKRGKFQPIEVNRSPD
jgi:hypothetical protein